MLISIGTLLYINYISIFAEDKQQQQQQEQNANIVSDANDLFTFFENFKNVTESPVVTESPIVSDNATIASTDYNFIAAGDWYCNEETKKTINNIITQHPELIITTDDQVKESPSASCWIEMSNQ